VADSVIDWLAVSVSSTRDGRFSRADPRVSHNSPLVDVVYVQRQFSCRVVHVTIRPV
jgi:hypothetical protein